MPWLERIMVFPIKSLDGVAVHESRVLPSAGLEHDRRWQLVDMEGRVVNAKRTPLMHVIRAQFQIDGVAEAGGEVSFSGEGNAVELSIDPAALVAGEVSGIDHLSSMVPETFPLVPGSGGPSGWLGNALGFDVLLVERRDGGFPDDRDAPGPTLAATATLMEVARWYGFNLDECRRRFRVNLEVGGCDAFWEDALASPMRQDFRGASELSHAELPADPYAALPPPEPREVRIGEVRLRVTNVCRRCAVPSRDSRTGRVTEHFRDVFESYRQRAIRHDVDAASWSHWYHLALNTVVLEAGPVTQGDQVRPV